MKRKEALLKDPNCEDCQRLWREYALGTTEHIRLDSKLRLAALEHDEEKIRTLTPEVERAEETRYTLRRAIREHDVKTHMEAASATD